MRGPLLLAVAGLLSLAACSGSDELDRGSLERTIERDLYPNAGFEVSEVRCPDEIPVGRTESVSCTVLVGDEDLTVDVVQVGSEGEVRIAPRSAVFETSALEDRVAKTLSDEVGVAITADCGDEPAIVVDVGSTIECRGVDEQGTPGPVTVRVTSLDGDLEVRPS